MASRVVVGWPLGPDAVKPSRLNARADYVRGAGDERSLSRRQDVRALMADLAGTEGMRMT